MLGEHLIYHLNWDTFKRERGTNNYSETLPSKPGHTVTLVTCLCAVLDLHISLKKGFPGALAIKPSSTEGT